MKFLEIAAAAQRDSVHFRFEKAGELIANLATACQALQDELATVKAELAALKRERSQ